MRGESFQTLIWRGKTSVESAWSLAPKLCCPTAAIQCASTAIETGKQVLHPDFSFKVPLSNNDQLMNNSRALWSYRNLRSESCPFCRGSIKRVKSGDLWVLTCGNDVVDPKTVMKEDILRLYLYINSLPKDVPDALFLMHYEYLI